MAQCLGHWYNLWHAKSFCKAGLAITFTREGHPWVWSCGDLQVNHCTCFSNDRGWIVQIWLSDEAAWTGQGRRQQTVQKTNGLGSFSERGGETHCFRQLNTFLFSYAWGLVFYCNHSTFHRALTADVAAGNNLAALEQSYAVWWGEFLYFLVFSCRRIKPSV